VTFTGSSLSAFLSNRKEALVKIWFDRILHEYPEASTRFLAQERDSFRNPIGHTLKESLSALFDGLMQPADRESLTLVLDDIVRIRAVQDFTADQAVSFPFLLKRILREELKAGLPRYSEEFTDLEARIDDLVLLAFDLYVKCRERLFEIRFNEAKRSMFMLERARPASRKETEKPHGTPDRQEAALPGAFGGEDGKPRQ
jgi:hypothetical protein